MAILFSSFLTCVSAASIEVCNSDILCSSSRRGFAFASAPTVAAYLLRLYSSITPSDNMRRLIAAAPARLMLLVFIMSWMLTLALSTTLPSLFLVWAIAKRTAFSYCDQRNPSGFWNCDSSVLRNVPLNVRGFCFLASRLATFAPRTLSTSCNSTSASRLAAPRFLLESRIFFCSGLARWASFTGKKLDSNSLLIPDMTDALLSTGMFSSLICLGSSSATRSCGSVSSSRLEALLDATS